MIQPCIQRTSVRLQRGECRGDTGRGVGHVWTNLLLRSSKYSEVTWDRSIIWMHATDKMTCIRGGGKLYPYRCFIVGIFSGQGHSRGETRRGLAAGDGVRRGAVASHSNMSYLTLDCKLPCKSVTSDESSTLVVYNYSSYTFTQGPFYYAKCFLNYGNKAWRTDIFFISITFL